MSNEVELTNAIIKRDVNEANRVLDEHPELLDETTESGISFVMLALYNGAEDILRSLTSRGGVRNVADAVAADDIELLATHLNRNPETASAYTLDGWTPLHVAAHFGREAALTTLISHRANVNAWSENDLKNQPLHAACAGEATEAMVKSLLDAGAEINTRARGGFTPLHLAASSGNDAVVKLLISCGANPQTRTDEGKTARELANETSIVAGLHVPK